MLLDIGALSMDFDTVEHEHVITSAPKEQWDITPQMINEIIKNVIVHRETGDLACPETAAFLQTNQFDAVPDAAQLAEMPNLRAPKVPCT
jgi:hypothetical protein